MNENAPIGRGDIAPVKSIGVPTPLVDGPEKLTGRARFSADFVEGDALVGRILRSPLAHAGIRRVDTAAAEAMEGVAAVVTGEDFHATFGVLPIAMNEWPCAR